MEHADLIQHSKYSPIQKSQWCKRGTGGPQSWVESFGLNSNCWWKQKEKIRHTLSPVRWSQVPVLLHLVISDHWTGLKMYGFPGASRAAYVWCIPPQIGPRKRKTTEKNSIFCFPGASMAANIWFMPPWRPQDSCHGGTESEGNIQNVEFLQWLVSTIALEIFPLTSCWVLQYRTWREISPNQFELLQPHPKDFYLFSTFRLWIYKGFSKNVHTFLFKFFN